METLSILVFILSAAFFTDAASVFLTEEPETQRSDKEVEEANATSVKPHVFPQARFTSCLDDWLYDKGNCYFLVNHAQSWSNAESYCSEYDSSLVSITSQWENKLIKRLLKTADHDGAWTGGFFFQHSWRWEDGSYFSFYDFAGHSSVYPCLSMSSDARTGWRSEDCNLRLPSVCKHALFC